MMQIDSSNSSTASSLSSSNGAVRYDHGYFSRNEQKSNFQNISNYTLNQALSHTANSLNYSPNTFSAFQPKSHYFFDKTTVRKLGYILNKPYKHFIETHEDKDFKKNLDFIRNQYPHLSLSLTAHSVFTQPVADLFASALIDRYRLSLQIFDNIKTCLQEALMNSVIHASLGIEVLEQTEKSFQHYMEKISELIQNKTLGLKRVSVYSWLTEDRLTICVADDGNGFDLNKSSTSLNNPYGRGLDIIRNFSNSVWQTDPGYLYMQFHKHFDDKINDTSEIR